MWFGVVVVWCIGMVVWWCGGMLVVWCGGNIFYINLPPLPKQQSTNIPTCISKTIILNYIHKTHMIILSLYHHTTNNNTTIPPHHHINTPHQSTPPLPHQNKYHTISKYRTITSNYHIHHHSITSDH